MSTKFFKNMLSAAVAAQLSMGVAQLASAENANFDIQHQRLDQALTQFAEQANIQLIFSKQDAQVYDVAGLSGNLDIDEALNQLLAGTGLKHSYSSENTVVIKATAGAGGAKSVDQGNRVLEEMIVTAQKREQSIKDVPMSIVAIGEAELEERGIESFQDLSLSVPGLAVEDSGPDHRRIFMRGLGNENGSSATVGVYVDELPATASPFLQPDLRVYDIQRVEVLRGPQGTLYGQGAMGGAIRFITKDPQLDRYGFKSDISASYTQDGSPSQQVKGMVNIPLVEGKFGLRIAGTFENAGGWMDQPAASREDINDQKVANVRVKSLWRPTEALDVKAMVMIHRNNAGTAPYGEDENGNYSQVFGLLTTPATDDEYELYNLTVSYDFGSVQLLSSTSYTDLGNEIYNYGQRLPLFPPPTPTLLAYSDFSQAASGFSQEVRLNSLGSDAWQWTLGAYYWDGETRDYTAGQHVGFSAPLPPIGASYVNEGTSKSWAVFGDTSYALTDRFEAGFGLRYFKDDATNRISFGGAPVPTLSETFDSVNPRFYMNFDVSEDVILYGSVAKGFRSGGFNGLGQPPYEPESVWTYELGTKASVFDGRLSVELAVFYSEYSDYLVRGILPPPAPALAITSNAGDVEIKGIDWSFTLAATDNLSLVFNGSVIDTEIVEVAATASSHIVGDPVDYIPDYQYTVSGVYDFALAGKSGFARLDYSKKGRSSYRNRSFGDHYFSESDIINMLNLHIKWNWSDTIAFGLFGSNLLNDRGYLDPASIRYWASRHRPRTVGLEVSMDFE